MNAESTATTWSTSRLPFPMDAHGTTPTCQAVRLLYPVDAHGLATTLSTESLPLPVLANPTTVARYTVRLLLAMGTLLADPHVADAVYGRYCIRFIYAPTEFTRILPKLEPISTPVSAEYL